MRLSGQDLHALSPSLRTSLWVSLRVSLLILACLLLGACGSRRAFRGFGAAQMGIPPIGGGRPSPARRFVVVDLRRATLRAAPEASAPRLVSEARGEAPALLSLRAVEATGEQEEWIEVETLGPESDLHCDPGSPILDGVRLRFFLRREQLTRVIADEETLRYADSTAMVLRPGVAMSPHPIEGQQAEQTEQAQLAQQAYDLHLGGLEIATPVPSSAIGNSYLAAGIFPTPGSDRRLAPAALEGGHIRLGRGGRLRASPTASPPIPARLAVYSAAPSQDGAQLAELRARCARLIVRARVEDLEEERAPGGDSVVGQTLAAYAAAGATVYSRDGTELGTVASDLALPEESASAGDRRCFRSPLTLLPQEGEAAKVELCFDRGALYPSIAQRLGNPR